MPRLKLTNVAAVAVVLAWLPAAPALAGPWLAPWAVGHVIGAALRLATLPLISARQPPPATPAPYWTGPAAPPVRDPPAGYYGPPAYYAPPPAYNIPPVGYYGSPQRYYPPLANRIPYLRSMPLPATFARYSAAGMRYSGRHGGALFNRSRGFAYRRW